MRPQLNDLRLLKLAEMYELAYERFVVEVAQRVVRDDGARAELMALVGPREERRARIVEELDRLNATLTPDDHAAVEAAAVQDVLDIEAAARAFYVQRVDQLHDPRLVRLFRGFAQAEDAQTRSARRALALVERGVARPATRTSAAERAAADDLLLRDV